MERVNYCLIYGASETQNVVYRSLRAVNYCLVYRTSETEQ